MRIKPSSGDAKGLIISFRMSSGTSDNVETNSTAPKGLPSLKLRATFSSVASDTTLPTSGRVSKYSSNLFKTSILSGVNQYLSG